MTTPTISTNTALEAQNLHVAYGEHTILKDLSVAFPAGEVTAIIGPNGCGKSTLLKALSQFLPSKGQLFINGEDARALSRRDLARRLAVLPQSPQAPDGITVQDLVSRGRHPHQSWFRQWSSADSEVVDACLEKTGVKELGDRPLSSLSGGQRQRAWLAMVLAQDTDLLLLDEPTTYLDLAHSVDVLRLVQTMKQEDGRTILMVLHDLNLAARFADHLVVMGPGRVAATGSAKEILTPELLADTFGLEAGVLTDPYHGGPLVVPR